MSDLTLKEEDILDKLSELKIDKSPGLDMLHPNVLYETRSMIAYPLSLAFNNSLQLTTSPSDWKLAESQQYIRKARNPIEAITGQLV